MVLAGVRRAGEFSAEKNWSGPQSPESPPPEDHNSGLCGTGFSLGSDDRCCLVGVGCLSCVGITDEPTRSWLLVRASGRPCWIEFGGVETGKID